MNENKKIIPVILCGGIGVRLWPLSSRETPKQFLRLIGPNSLLQDTVLRAQSVIGCNPDDIVTVSHESMKKQIIEHYSELDVEFCTHILSEPHARNTGPAIAIAALYIKENFGPDALMWILPSDHFIGDEAALRESVQKAVIAASLGYLTIFGIKPTKPETGYGYINEGAQLWEGASNVASFLEKPDINTAIDLLQSGHCYWNSGMFVATTATTLEAFETQAPAVLNKVKAACNIGTRQLAVDSHTYAALENVSFDILIMQNAMNRAVIPTDPAWSDIGSWDNLKDIQDKDNDGNITKGNVNLSNCRNVMVQSDEKPVTCLGVSDIIVVNTPCGILVTGKDQSATLKSTVTHIYENTQSTYATMHNSAVQEDLKMPQITKMKTMNE